MYMYLFRNIFYSKANNVLFNYTPCFQLDITTYAIRNGLSESVKTLFSSQALIICDTKIKVKLSSLTYTVVEKQRLFQPIYSIVL